jgi:hypothetical protein
MVAVMTGMATFWLMYGLVPMLIIAGLADWWCHKRSGIELSSGVPESIFHLVMCLQSGLITCAVIFLEVNAFLLVLVLVVFLAHELTTWIELRLVWQVRPISPAEQMVHSFQEILPFAAFLLLATEYGHRIFDFPQLESAEWHLQFKAASLSPGYLITVLLAVVLLNLLPLAEELYRCWRYRALAKPRRHFLVMPGH